MRSPPIGWIELENGDFASPSSISKGLVSSKPKATQSCVKEAELHAQILDFCRAQGWPVVHSRMDRPSTAKIGTPDFVVALPGGRTIWVEAKTAKGKLSVEQNAWLAGLRKLGHHAGVVRNIHEFVMMTEVRK